MILMAELLLKNSKRLIVRENFSRIASLKKHAGRSLLLHLRTGQEVRIARRDILDIRDVEQYFG